MADAKLTALTAVTSAGVGSLLYMVADPSGTPVSNSITTSNLFLSRTVGGPSVIGLQGNNNASTPNSQYDLSATVLNLWEPSTGNIVVRANVGPFTNNISTAGPAAGGRDQAGAFVSGNFINFYFIWNGSTISTISSLATPPTGPTMPGNYTHWAYAGSVRMVSSVLDRVMMRGAWQYYDNSGDSQHRVLANGNVTSFTIVECGEFIPANSQYALLTFVLSCTPAAGTSIAQVKSMDVSSNATLVGIWDATVTVNLWTIQVPVNADREIQYQLNQAQAAGGINIDVNGYMLLNGGE